MHWLTLLAEDVARSGSKAATARRVGVSRTAVSLALAEKYPADDTRRLEGKVLAALAGRVACPHDGTDIARRACADRATSPMPMSSPAALRAWMACRTCPHSRIGGTTNDQS
jgi:hypothetical protein